MTKHIKNNLFTLLLLLTAYTPQAFAEDKIELEMTTIKGNKELPKILYVVPWKDMASTKGQEQKLVLHSLFGDLFEPVIPMVDYQQQTTSGQ
ncbi:MAG: hypothetical protein OEY89_10045 [Gammaproteobacteria bacterium]|nr:hypothetical protein [Gammaproteobacteria bacterium]